MEKVRMSRSREARGTRRKAWSRARPGRSISRGETCTPPGCGGVGTLSVGCGREARPYRRLSAFRFERFSKWKIQMYRTFVFDQTNLISFECNFLQMI